jgi:hypothetical protein
MMMRSWHVSFYFIEFRERSTKENPSRTNRNQSQKKR